MRTSAVEVRSTLRLRSRLATEEDGLRLERDETWELISISGMY